MISSLPPAQVCSGWTLQSKEGGPVIPSVFPSRSPFCPDPAGVRGEGVRRTEKSHLSPVLRQGCILFPRLSFLGTFLVSSGASTMNVGKPSCDTETQFFSSPLLPAQPLEVRLRQEVEMLPPGSAPLSSGPDILSRCNWHPWLWSPVASAYSSLKQGFGFQPEIEVRPRSESTDFQPLDHQGPVVRDKALAHQLCRNELPHGDGKQWSKWNTHC